MQYKHDCGNCQPLGEYGNTDLYFCGQNGLGNTVIARYSDVCDDYQSGLAFADNVPTLKEAKKRAIEAGYLTPNVEVRGAEPRFSAERPS